MRFCHAGQLHPVDKQPTKETNNNRPLKGQKHDARKFIPDVLSKGAAVILAEKGFEVPQKAKASFLLVEDSLKALQALAKYHRLNSTLKVAAITGSNGKSTTKQMLRAICETAGETAANMGNFNNQDRKSVV